MKSKKYHAIIFFMKEREPLKYRNVKPGQERNLLQWVERNKGAVLYGNVYENQHKTFIFRIYPDNP